MTGRPRRLTGGRRDDVSLAGGEVSRIEGFSDGVFAFALTLLVVSLEVPRSLEDLIPAPLDHDTPPKQMDILRP